MWVQGTQSTHPDYAYGTYMKCVGTSRIFRLRALCSAPYYRQTNKKGEIDVHIAEQWRGLVYICIICLQYVHDSLYVLLCKQMYLQGDTIIIKSVNYSTFWIKLLFFLIKQQRLAIFQTLPNHLQQNRGSTKFYIDQSFKCFDE